MSGFLKKEQLFTKETNKEIIPIKSAQKKRVSP